jgi:hypothetical protein
MLMRGGALRYSIVVLLLTAFGWSVDSHAVHAQETTPPPFEFAKTDALSLSWNDLREKSTSVEVLNNRTNNPDLTVQLSLLELKDSAGNPLEVSQALKYDPSLSLPSAGSAALTIRAGDISPKPGKYDGSLTVSQPSTDTVARRSVNLTVEDPKAQEAVKPLVERCLADSL